MILFLTRMRLLLTTALTILGLSATTILSAQTFTLSNVVTGNGGSVQSSSSGWSMGSNIGAPGTQGLWSFVSAQEIEAALPVQLSTLEAVASNHGVVIEWTTVSEENNYGFYVERRAESTPRFGLMPNSFTPGNGTSLEEHHYSWKDTSVVAGTYYYRLKQIDLEGGFAYSSPIKIVVESVTGVTSGELPTAYALRQNYPNPFNPSTVIQFDLPIASNISIKVFNTLGQMVSVPISGVQDAGFRIVSFDASQLASGVYFYHIDATGVADPSRHFSKTMKMLLVR